MHVTGKTQYLFKAKLHGTNCRTQYIFLLRAKLHEMNSHTQYKLFQQNLKDSTDVALAASCISSNACQVMSKISGHSEDTTFLFCVYEALLGLCQHYFRACYAKSKKQRENMTKVINAYAIEQG